MKQFSIVFLLFFISLFSKAQSNLKIFRITSAFTSFPDTNRSKGHVYQNVLYDAANHYSDSSVLIITPKKLDSRKKVNMIFWFHGWSNNLDSTVVRYELGRQFAESKINAVLVLAETAKDAPDSYGGKLEQVGVFNHLVYEVLLKLKEEKVVSKNCKTGNIMLAGHSGAYRVMANILQNGNVPIKEVILFDALYAETDKFLSWIQSNNNNRFINLYTNNGGTDDESKAMLNKLIALKIKVHTLEEKNLTPQRLKQQKILFIHSLSKHNEIINTPDNFLLFITNTPVLKKID